MFVKDLDECLKKSLVLKMNHLGEEASVLKVRDDVLHVHVKLGSGEVS